jgi:putative peptidoglycan lipid II flippase
MSSLGRSSALIGAGTLVSRLTGLVRNFVLAAALGVVGSTAADAFGIANQFPNTLFTLISSGLLAGIIVPQIVSAVRTHVDGGSAFVSKLLTLGTVVLAGVTALAMIAAPLLVAIYGGRLTPSGQALALALAYWCLPQLFFYGLHALVGEALNARRIFGPFAWSPIVNNVVSIAGFGAFIWLFGLQSDAGVWTPEMIALMGGTATLGVILQAVVLLFFWRRAGLHLRADFQWRGIGLRHIARLAGWTFLMVVVSQIAGAVQANLVSAASGVGTANASLQYAWLVFMLPFSVVVLSIGTPYYTRLSEHVAEGRTEAATSDLAALTRTIGVFMVGILAAMIAAIVPLMRIFTRDADGAVALAWVLAAYLVALLPLSFQFGIQRTFYALRDTRTPFLYTLVQAVLVIVSAIVAFAVLPLEWLAVGIALGQSVANVAQLALAVFLLRRKIGPLALGGAVRSVIRFVIAAIPAGVIGWWIFELFGGTQGWAVSDKFAGLLAAGLIGVVTLAVYVLFLALLRAPELRTAFSALRRFLPGR